MQRGQNPADKILQEMSEQDAQEILKNTPIAPDQFTVDFSEGELVVTQTYFADNHEDETVESMRESLEDELDDMMDQYDESGMDVEAGYEMQATDETLTLRLTHQVDDKSKALLAVANFTLSDVCYNSPSMAMSFMHEKSQIASMNMLAREKLGKNDGSDSPDYIK